jgi:hypothetical protein
VDRTNVMTYIIRAFKKPARGDGLRPHRANLEPVFLCPKIIIDIS